NLELAALDAAREKFSELGAAVVAISPQVEAYARYSVEKNGLHFDVLSDPGNAVARRFGLSFQVPEDLKRVYIEMKLDLPRYNGDDSWQLPMPARFVVDREGIIRYADFDPDYTTRPDPEETLAALRELSGA
ncbi:MAG TPA: peroxiredoxin-like family protein, partial [Candidatus Dormibacteraeota bacterium]|nr:peroxiredoxin-like family protein [Candidatus Dormibacteraeota bacterium]